MVVNLNYDPRRRGVETEVDREVRLFMKEMRLQDVSYSGAPGSSHYPTGRQHAVTNGRGVRGPKVGQGGDGRVYGGARQYAGQERALPPEGDSGRVGGGARRQRRILAEVKRGGAQSAAAGTVAWGGGREVAAVGAASARRNEAGEPCTLSHEESSESVRVQQTGGGVAGTA